MDFVIEIAHYVSLLFILFTFDTILQFTHYSLYYLPSKCHPMLTQFVRGISHQMTDYETNNPVAHLPDLCQSPT